VYATAASRTSTRPAAIHAPRAASFLLKNTRGSRRTGSRIHEVAAPETVSVKTTVICQVPWGVVEEVAIVNVLVVAE
jgi:hypothetical protein